MKVKGKIKDFKSEKGLFSPRPYIYIILILFFNISLNLSLFGATTYSICASGCDYTSLQTAYNSAASGDTLEFHEDYTGNLSMVATKSCNITSSTGNMFTWDGADSVTSTLYLESGAVYPAWTISNVIMDHSSSSGGYVIELHRGGSGDINPNLTIDQCILKRTSTSTTNARIITNNGTWDGGASTAVTLTRTEIIGTSNCDGLWYGGGNNTHAYDLTNCILRGFTGTRRAIYDNGNNFGININMMNCTLYNNNEAYRASGSANDAGRYITNCLFLSNTSDVANLNSSRKGDFTYCAISGSGYGTGCQYNPTTAEIVSTSGPDLHLSEFGTMCIDLGTNTGAPSDDYDGNSRPYNTTTDIGAYEWAPAISMVKTANNYIATIGDTITFCITYTNNMGSAQSFNVWDTVPAEMTYVGCDSCSVDYFGDITVVWWPLSNIADDGSGTLCFWATVTSYPYFDLDKKYFSYWEKWNTLAGLFVEKAVTKKIANSREGV